MKADRRRANPDLGVPRRFVDAGRRYPLRWRLMGELVRSDRTVRELTVLIDEPQSLVSYHFRLSARWTRSALDEVGGWA